MPSLRAVLHACSAVALVLAAACADSTSPRVQPTPGEPAASLRLVCNASVAKRTVECVVPGAAEGVRADRILGQGAGMKLTSSNLAIVADSFTFDMTVTNQLAYPVGTTDGVNPDPDGIRVFFVDGIHTTGGTGSVTVANADGVDAFTATGQAYFAYHGVLQPGATTAAKRWKLRFEPGVETFSFGLYISTPVPPGGGYVAMTVLAPALGAVVGNSVDVRVRVDSASASVLSVRANVGDRSVLLTPVSAGVVAGALSLAGLAAGPVQLRVHAVTLHADTGTVLLPLIKDAPPVVTVLYPTGGVVPRPNLRIDFDCSDDDPAGCTGVSATVRGAASDQDFTTPRAEIMTAAVASGTTGIHTDVSLAAFDEKALRIDLAGTDSRGQSTKVTVDGYAQSSAALVFVDSAGYRAMDVDAARLLFSASSGDVRMRDRGTGSRTLLAEGLASPSGWLHPLGAIFFGDYPGYPIYDWRSGTLVSLGEVSQASLRVAGSWAVWSYRSSLIRRDLATGTNSTVSTIAGAGRADVDANGDVVFGTDNFNGYDIYRYSGGVTTPVAVDLDTAHHNTTPVFAGTGVLYLRTDQRGKTPHAQKARVALWNGTTTTTLTDTISDPHYAASGGWIAYESLDGAGIVQVRTRAPDGTDRQVTTGFTRAYFGAVGPDGTLVYVTSGGTYAIRAPYTSPPTRLGAYWLRPSFRGTELLLFLGNTVFRGSY